MFHRNLLPLFPWEKSKASSTFKTEAAGSSETMVMIYYTTECHVKRDNNPWKYNNFCSSQEIIRVVKSKEYELERACRMVIDVCKMYIQFSRKILREGQNGML
jgi:hypothetical protein